MTVATDEMIESWLNGGLEDWDGEHSYIITIYSKYLLDYYKLQVKQLEKDGEYGIQEFGISLVDEDTFSVAHPVPVWIFDVDEFDEEEHLIKHLGLKNEWIESISMDG